MRREQSPRSSDVGMFDGWVDASHFFVFVFAFIGCTLVVVVFSLSSATQAEMPQLLIASKFAVPQLSPVLRRKVRSAEPKH